MACAWNRFVSETQYIKIPVYALSICLGVFVTEKLHLLQFWCAHSEKVLVVLQRFEDIILLAKQNVSCRLSLIN